MPTFVHVVERLTAATTEPEHVVPAQRELEALVFNDEAEYERLTPFQQDILADLADRLDLFEPNPEWRAHDASFFGPDRAVDEIRAALDRLRRNDEG